MRKSITLLALLAFAMSVSNALAKIDNIPNPSFDPPKVVIVKILDKWCTGYDPALDGRMELTIISNSKNSFTAKFMWQGRNEPYYEDVKGDIYPAMNGVELRFSTGQLSKEQPMEKLFDYALYPRPNVLYGLIQDRRVSTRKHSLIFRTTTCGPGATNGAVPFRE